jgi:hypothetical protein
VTAFTDEHCERFGVEPICRTLGVSASAYYHRARGERSARAIEDERLLALIRETHQANHEAYGYRRDLEGYAGICRITLPDPPRHLRSDRAPGRGRLPARLRGPSMPNGEQYREARVGQAGRARGAALAAHGVVGSLSFPALSPGTVVDVGFTVLEPEDRYPMSSFTLIRAGGLPLLIVHAPGGVYALGWNWSGPPGTYRSTCDHLLSERAREIYCTCCEARRDRIGGSSPHQPPRYETNRCTSRLPRSRGMSMYWSIPAPSRPARPRTPVAAGRMDRRPLRHYG